jgi:hypothetical protein
MAEFALRCDRCRHFLAHARSPLQLDATVRASSARRVSSTPGEERHRCLSCGFVNIFTPIKEAPLPERQRSQSTDSWRDISVKA